MAKKINSHATNYLEYYLNAILDIKNLFRLIISINTAHITTISTFAIRTGGLFKVILSHIGLNS